MVPSFALGILAIACCSFCGGEYNHHLGAAPATRTETIDSIDMEFPEPQSPEGPCHSSSSPMSRFRSGTVVTLAFGYMGETRTSGLRQLVITLFECRWVHSDRVSYIDWSIAAHLQMV